MDHRHLVRLALSGLVAGGLSVSACNKDSSTGNTEGNDTVAARKAAFKADCEAQGKMYGEHDCADFNNCAGLRIDGDKVSEHDCKDHNDCAGAYCTDA